MPVPRAALGLGPGVLERDGAVEHGLAGDGEAAVGAEVGEALELDALKRLQLRDGRFAPRRGGLRGVWVHEFREGARLVGLGVGNREEAVVETPTAFTEAGSAAQVSRVAVWL